MVVLAGLQYGLPGTWEGLQASGLSPEILTSIWSTYPAKLAGLGDRKGALAAGYDADIVVRETPLPACSLWWGPCAMAPTASPCKPDMCIPQVWDPQSLADTSTGHLQHRHKVTAYEDAQLHGRVHATFVRGHQARRSCATTMLQPFLECCDELLA